MFLNIIYYNIIYIYVLLLYYILYINLIRDLQRNIRRKSRISISFTLCILQMHEINL